MASPRFVARSAVPGWHRCNVAFTLVEMLVVITIVVILLALIAPAVTNLNSAGNLSRAAFDIAGSLDRARAYAMANNTYVWVGLAEQDASTHLASAPAGFGAVTLATVASTIGLRAYDPDNPGALNASQIKPVDRSLRFDNLHLTDAYTPATTPSGMTRPAVNPSDEVGGTNGISSTPFTAPANGGQQVFSKVIEFNPQGVTRIVTSGASAQSVPDLIEIILLPTHGSAPQTPAINAAAIQVSGLTGASRVYQP